MDVLEYKRSSDSHHTKPSPSQTGRSFKNLSSNHPSSNGYSAAFNSVLSDDICLSFCLILILCTYKSFHPRETKCKTFKCRILNLLTKKHVKWVTKRAFKSKTYQRLMHARHTNILTQKNQSFHFCSPFLLCLNLQYKRIEI